MRRKELHEKLSFYLCALIAFFLPVYINIVPLLIAMLVVNWLAEANFSEKFLMLKSNKIVFLLAGLYFLYVTGMLWTENKESGWFDLQIKLSLLIFPVFFSTSKINQSMQIIRVFIYGCAVAGAICSIIAFYYFFTSGENRFEYTAFSYILHPAYFSMYTVFAIAASLFTFDFNDPRKIKIFNAFLILFLSAIVILLGSKSGVVLLSFIVITYFFFIVKQRTLFAFSFLIIIAAGIILIFKFFPTLEKRIEISIRSLENINNINPNDLESSSERLLIWKSDLIVLKNNAMTGVGTGDVTDELVKTYNAQGYSFLSEHRFNAHNQFLQTTIAVGVLGSLLLLFSFLFPLLKSIREKNILLVSFLIIMFLNFLVESMLETQAGVIFYAFFYSLLLISQEEKA
jgi:O-antigen ligase